MYPHDVSLFGVNVSIWNVAFAIAVLAGAVVLRANARDEPRLTLPLLRYVVVVYLSALAAQVFAYAFDVNTSLTPPPGISLVSYYLSPVAGPKTLYGVIVLMPVSVWVATIGTRLPLAAAIDLWTPPMLVVLCTARIGCLLQGCCYGAPSSLFGMTFAAGSPVYSQQLGAGLITANAGSSLPVVPTQLLEFAFLAALALWSSSRRRHTPPPGLFLGCVASYSIFRFWIEFVRADAGRGIYGALSTSQWIALVVFAVTIPALVRPFLPRARPA